LIYSKRLADRGGDNLDIIYHYRNTRIRIILDLNYRTRATPWDIERDELLAGNLHSDRCPGLSGKWDKPSKWELAQSDKKLQAIVSLEQDKYFEFSRFVIQERILVLRSFFTAERGGVIRPGYNPRLSRVEPTNRLLIPTDLTEPAQANHDKPLILGRRLIERAGGQVSFLGDFEAS